MNRFRRLILAGLIVLSGLALMPYVGFPSERFSWRQFAGIYDSQPTLTVNHIRGHRDSVFTVRGTNFAPNAQLNIKVNTRYLGSVTADNRGRVTFLLTTDDADEGFYGVWVNQQAATSFWIDNNAPRWPAEGTGPQFAIPDDIALTVYMYFPLMSK